MPQAKPYSLRQTLTNPLARMLPLRGNQQQVYRLGEKHPPAADVPGSGPVWEVANFVLPAFGTSQARINLQRFFTLMAVSGSATVNTVGGFRVQFFDLKKERRFADRGEIIANFAGSLEPFFLREPYQFDQPDSLILVQVQNFESVSNTVQVVFFGHVLRFNEPSPGVPVLPGGPIPSQILG
jgi:hypothetical protein